MKNIVKLKNIIDQARSSGIKVKDETKRTIDSLMVVQAQEFQAPIPKRINPSRKELMNLLACLRVNLIYMQHAHWVAKGDPSYGDHILFERVYKELLEEIDEYAERIIGLAGESVADPIEVLRIAAEKMPTIIRFKPKAGNKSLAKYALNSVRHVLDEIEKLYAMLKEEDNLTLGLDDLLMSMHGLHEKHLYLLQQRLK